MDLYLSVEQNCMWTVIIVTCICFTLSDRWILIFSISNRCWTIDHLERTHAFRSAVFPFYVCHGVMRSLYEPYHFTLSWRLISAPLATNNSKIFVKPPMQASIIGRDESYIYTQYIFKRHSLKKCCYLTSSWPSGVAPNFSSNSTAWKPLESPSLHAANNGESVPS